MAHFTALALLPSVTMTANEIKALLNLHRIRRGAPSAALTLRGTGLARGVPPWDGYLLQLEPGTSLRCTLDSDEISTSYLGDPVEMLQLHSDGSRAFTLGPDLAAGHHVQLVVPRESGGTRYRRRQSGTARLHRNSRSTFADYRSGTYAS